MPRDQGRHERILSRRTDRAQCGQASSTRDDAGGQFGGDIRRPMSVVSLLSFSSVLFILGVLRQCLFADSPLPRIDSSQSVLNANQSRVLILCYPEDDICRDGDIVVLEHLTYSAYAYSAAAFIVSNAGL